MMSRVTNVMKHTRLAFLALPLILLSACGRQDPASAQAAREKQFQESLNGVTLAGRFSMGEAGRLSEEKYTIEKVSKVGAETWLFHARLQYGSHDVTLPLPLTVKWADDTPVITLTDLAIPGVGTYTARVMFYRGQYAGTWSGKGAGGHLFGRIVKNKPSS